MLDDIKLENLLFIDIETVSGEADFDKISPKLQDLWEKKSNYFRSEEQTASDVYARAGIYAEFGKVVCISTGVIVRKGDGKHFIVKSYYGHDEKQLLTDFGEMLDRFCSKPTKNLCAHNGKEFDFPYIARRMLINGLKLHKALNISGNLAIINIIPQWHFCAKFLIFQRLKMILMDQWSVRSIGRKMILSVLLSIAKRIFWQLLSCFFDTKVKI